MCTLVVAHGLMPILLLVRVLVGVLQVVLRAVALVLRVVQVGNFQVAHLLVVLAHHHRQVCLELS